MESMQQLVDELISVFKMSVGENNLEKILNTDTTISRRVNLLVALQNGLNINSLNIAQKFEFYCCLSDALILSSASGTIRETFESIKISDSTLLGRRANIKTIYEGQAQKLFEWLFSKSVQADLNNKFNVNCKDLESNSRFKNKRVCDYLVEENELTELIECKKINVQSKHDNWIIHCSNKIANHFSLKEEDRKKSAAWQFKSTITELNLPYAINHLIVNITDYAKKGLKISKLSGVKFVGFHEEEINALVDSIKRKVSELDNTIHRLTITWEEQVFIKNFPVSISTLSRNILLINNKSTYNFNRGNVEAYPDKGGRLFHLRCGKTSHNHAYLKLAFENIVSPEKFWTTGAPESTK